MVYFPLIVKQGDPADGMFFVEGGIVEVFVDGASGTRKKVIFIKGERFKKTRQIMGQIIFLPFW